MQNSRKITIHKGAKQHETDNLADFSAVACIDDADERICRKMDVTGKWYTLFMGMQLTLTINEDGTYTLEREEMARSRQRVYL